MNARKMLQEIWQYLEMTRQVGHTTGMLKGVNNSSDGLVLVVNNDQRQHFKKSYPIPEGVEFSSIQSETGLRGYRKPLFVDNGALWLLCKEASAEFDKLEAENKKLRAKLADATGFCPP